VGLIDTHCHLADLAFDGEHQAVLARASDALVGHVITVGDNPERSELSRRLAREFPAVSATAGLHPHEASNWSAEVAVWLESALGDPVVVAVGETGLDYHYDHSPRDMQREAFEAQLDIGTRLERPVIVHAREADEDIAAILGNHPGATAILHSYSSGAELFHQAVAMGHYISWSGMITFRNWALDELIRAVPTDRLLVETDSPYLAPVPHRGRRNEPAFTRVIAERLATVLGQSIDEVIEATTTNAVRVFGSRLITTQEVL
jgi:TatD DNase family protein